MANAAVGASAQSLEALQAAMGLRFEHIALLEQALTHRSKQGAAHYERLEFLGDAVLQLIMTQWLYTRYPQHDEGWLSRRRTDLVREETLYQVACRMQLKHYLRLGEGEQRAGGALRPSILADVVEALIGAAYLDRGWELTTQWVQRWFLAFLEAEASTSSASLGKDKDAKTTLQEYLQALQLNLPHYTIERIEGPEHAQVFRVLCQVDMGKHGVVQCSGQGRTRKLAEQDAAAQVLHQCRLASSAHKDAHSG